MEKLPTVIWEQILTDEAISVFDIFNTLKTCRQLRTAIEGNNFIWKPVFFRRWPELPPLMKLPNREDIDWFNELKNNIKVELRSRHLGATMSSLTNLKRQHFFSSDLTEWYELIAEGKYNHLYVLKNLHLIINEKCNINGITASPTTPGNLTLRYYCREVFYQLYQQKCLKDLEEFLKVPENCCTLEKCATIAANLLEPFIDRSYGNIRKILDTIANKVKEHLRNINSNHPLFAVSENIQLSWKDQDDPINESTFEEHHVCEVFQAFNDFNIFYSSDYECYKNCRVEIDQCLDYFRPFNGNTDLPRIFIILESICRRLGVAFMHFESIHYCFKIFIKNQLRNFIIDRDETGIPNIRSVCYYGFMPPVYKLDRLAAGQMIIRLLTIPSRKIFWRNPLGHQKKLILRLKMLLEPDKFEHIKNFSELFENFVVCEKHWEANKSDYEGLKLENLLISHLNRFKEWGTNNCVPPQRILSDKSIFAIGSIVIDKRADYKLVIVGSTRICAKQDFWEFYKYKTICSEQNYFLVMNKFGDKSLASTDYLILDENPTTFTQCTDDIFLGKYFSHFFGKQYIPNKEWVALINNEIERRRSATHKLKSYVLNNVTTCKII